MPVEPKMNPKPFKFRHVNRIAGAFLFLSAAILVLLVAFAGKSQKWFEEKTRYLVEMPAGQDEVGPDGTLGIRAGSDVRVIGSPVGYVESVELYVGEDRRPVDAVAQVDPREIRLVAVLSVKGAFSSFIGPDSVAVLKYDLGGLGSAYFDISRGSRRFDLPEEGGGASARELAFGRERDAKQEVFEVVSRIENELVPAIRRIEETAAEAKTFFETLNDEEGYLNQSFVSLEAGSADFRDVMAQAAGGDGVLGDMIQSDTKMRREFNEFAVSLNRGTQSLERSVDSFGEGMGELREGGIASFTEAAKQFPATVRGTNGAIGQIDATARQFQEVLREFEILVEGLQKHWIVRKHIVDPIEDPKPTAPQRGEAAAEKEGLLKKLFNKEQR